MWAKICGAHFLGRGSWTIKKPKNKRGTYCDRVRNMINPWCKELYAQIKKITNSAV